MSKYIYTRRASDLPHKARERMDIRLLGIRSLAWRRCVGAHNRSMGVYRKYGGWDIGQNVFDFDVNSDPFLASLAALVAFLVFLLIFYTWLCIYIYIYIIVQRLETSLLSRFLSVLERVCCYIYIYIYIYVYNSSLTWCLLELYIYIYITLMVSVSIWGLCDFHQKLYIYIYICLPSLPLF